MVEIPWGTWGEAHSRRRHQGRQGAVLLAELIRRRPGGGTLGSPGSAYPFWLTHRQPSSSRQPSTSSPWSRKRLGYCSRTPSSSGSSRYCPRDGTGGNGTILAGQGGDVICSSLGSGWDPLLCSARDWRCSFGKAGIQPGISYPEGGEGLGSHFPLFPLIWGVRDGLVAVLVLGCPG